MVIVIGYVNLSAARILLENPKCLHQHLCVSDVIWNKPPVYSIILNKHKKSIRLSLSEFYIQLHRYNKGMRYTTCKSARWNMHQTFAGRREKRPEFECGALNLCSSSNIHIGHHIYLC
jgi:hypothetical protein